MTHWKTSNRQQPAETAASPNSVWEEALNFKEHWWIRAGYNCWHDPCLKEWQCQGDGHQADLAKAYVLITKRPEIDCQHLSPSNGQKVLSAAEQEQRRYPWNQKLPRLSLVVIIDHGRNRSGFVLSSALGWLRPATKKSMFSVSEIQRS